MTAWFKTDTNETTKPSPCPNPSPDPCYEDNIIPVALTELLEEQSRGLLALRRGLDGTSTLSPCPMLRVMGRFLCVGLVASSSPPRSTGLLGGSEPFKREIDGDGLFS